MSEPVSRTPFYKPDPRGWPAIAELLPKPWPEEAIAHDLVWWADQVAIGRVVKMPGAVTLAARWGLSRHSRRVRLALGYIVAPEGPVCCAGPGAYPARGWRAAGASVAHFLDDSDDCTSPAGAPLAHDWRVLGASVARDSGGQIDEEPANDAAPDAAPRARGTEPRSQIPDHETHHAPEPAQAPTATPEPIARAGDAPSADEPVTIGRRAGPLGNEQQRQAALDAVADPPPPRAPVNLTIHQGEPKPPPPYHVGGKVLPGTLRDLVGNAAAQVLAPHFRWDSLRSPTQKLFDAADLRFIRGLTPVFLVELALEFDRRWGLRPKGLQAVEVPWVDFGGEVADELERLHTFQRGVQPSAEQARGLIPDDARRAAFNAALKALGDGSIRDGWGVVGERVRVRLAAK